MFAVGLTPLGTLVAEAQDKEAQQDNQPMPPQKASSRTLAVVVPLVALAAVSAACAYASSKFHYFAEQSLNQTASAAIPDPGVTLPLKDILSSQEKSAVALESMAQSFSTQQADLKLISDKLSALAARMDDLKNAAAPLTTSSIPLPTARARVIRMARRKSSQLPEPVGPVSVGGAPLNPVPAQPIL
jgi:hypothetical protein